MSDLTDIVAVMRKADAFHGPAEANSLLTGAEIEITRLRGLENDLLRILRAIAYATTTGAVETHFTEDCDLRYHAPGIEKYVLREE